MIFLLLFACVIRYGEPVTWEKAEEVVEHIDFRPLETRLIALLEESQGVDKRDRLLQAQVMCKKARYYDMEVQKLLRRHLLSLIEIEERERPIQISNTTSKMMKMESMKATIVEETLEGKPEAPVSPIIEKAKQQLTKGRYKEAINTLQACKKKDCWVVAWPTLREAENRFVAREMVKSQQEAKQINKMESVKKRKSHYRKLERRLKLLIKIYPNSVHVEAVQSQIKELENARNKNLLKKKKKDL